MRIVVEASSFYGRRSGVGRYGLLLNEALAALRPNDSFEYVRLKSLRKQLSDFGLEPNVSSKVIWWFSGRVFSVLMRNGFSLPLEFFGLMKADVILFPNFIAWASLLGKKRISVVHDLAFVHYPEYIQKKNLIYLQRQLPKSLRRSAKVIAVSEATKADLVEHYAVSPEKIAVIYNAVDHQQFNLQAKKNTPAVLRKYKLPKEYLLFVGTIEPRKNIIGLLNAYAAGYVEHKLPLVIVGGEGWNDTAIEDKFRLLSNLPVYRIGFVADDELPALYAGAVAFVYPSFYEGFGIPVLEAMACGCPVVCSDVSSLPEVTGEAAMMVDPNNEAELASAISEIAANPGLRKQLTEAGIKQARKFSWEKSAKLLSEVIDEVANG